MYWDEVWDRKDIDEYKKYIAGYNDLQNSMTEIFKANGCKDVCDAACGFGANSLVLLSNGFNVFGYDIAEDSVWITINLLSEYGAKAEQFKVASLLDTGYEKASFDAVAIRAALDHLCIRDAKKALIEAERITKPGGLIYASFDPLEEEELEMPHEVTEDGSFLFTGEGRKGLLFHYYSDEMIRDVFSKYEIVSFEKDVRGNRHIIARV